MKILDKLKEKGFVVRVLGGFFAIMFALTVLSRMADSITIPGVKVSSPKNSQLTHEVELDGTVKVKDEASIEASPGFTVKKVHIKKGDKVKQGDLLMTLDTTEVEDKLEQARAEVQKLGIQARQLDLEVPLPDSKDPVGEAERALKRFEEDREIKEDELIEKLERAKKDIELAQEELESAKEELNLAKEELSKAGEKQEAKEKEKREEEIEKAKEAVADASKELDNKKYEKNKALKTAQMAIDQAEDQFYSTEEFDYGLYRAIDHAKSEYKMMVNDWERTIKDYEEQLKKANKKLETLKGSELTEIDEDVLKAEIQNIKAQEKNLQTVERALEEKRKSFEDIQGGKDKEFFGVERQIEDANFELEKAKAEERDGELTRANQELKSGLQKDLISLDIGLKIREIKNLEELKASGGLITAPADGTIMEIKLEEGNQTTGGKLLTMVTDEAAYEFVAEVSIGQEKYMQIGDPVKVTLQGESKPLKGTIINDIVNTIGEGENKKQVCVDIPKGTLGMSARLSMVKETEKYTSVLPVGALREGQMGKYVLVVREKSTTLGEELVVESVDVQVLDRNQTLMAIKGGIDSNDKIVVESNKTIEVGDRVRLKE